MGANKIKYDFRPMTIECIEAIGRWQYEGVVAGIYTDPYLASHAAGDLVLRGPAGCSGYAAFMVDRLIGLFEYYFQDGIMEIGLALAPEMVGQGHGRDFVLAGVKFGIKEFSYAEDYIRLTVSVDNLPAIRVYEKAGFLRISETEREITMHYPCG